MSINKKYSAYKSRAKAKDIKFNLNKKQFEYIIEDKCHYCSKENAGGIDRVDNNRGYTSGNSVPSCWDCNRTKSNMSREEFYGFIKRFGGKVEFDLEDRIREKTKLFMMNPKLGKKA